MNTERKPMQDKISGETGRILAGLGLQAVNPGAFSGKDWHAAADAPLIDSINPATGEVIARIRAAGAEDYERVMTSAAAAFAAWRDVPAPRRGEAVRLMGEALRAKKDLLGSLVSLEMGKIKAEGDGEVQEMIDIADFAVGQSRMLYGLSMHSERPRHRMYEQWHPLGVVGIISAFNFPVAVWSWNAFLAAVCGDICVWKPSHHTPLCAIAVQRICNEVIEAQGLPPIFQLFIPADNALASRFVDDKRVALMSFTGSTRSAAASASASLRASGGACSSSAATTRSSSTNTRTSTSSCPPCSSARSARPASAARRRVASWCRSRGSTKSSAGWSRATSRCGSAIRSIPKTLMGPLVGASAVRQYEAALSDAKSQGGEILCGGRTLPGPGYFVEPTIVRARNDMPVVRHETFAPILYVIPFKTLDDAIAMHNDTDYGLSSAIFTDRLQHAERFLSVSGSDCGIANVNIGTSGAEIGGAFGGEKDTGGGREAGSDSWKTYMRRQTNTINYSSDLPLAQGIKFDVT